MATQYPENDNDQLVEEIQNLRKRNSELNIALMRKSAEASEAKEDLRRCRLEWEIVAAQKGHNLCWVAIAKALKATIGHTGKYPDPDNITGEEFAQGCVEFHKSLYPDCVARLDITEVRRVK